MLSVRRGILRELEQLKKNKARMAFPGWWHLAPQGTCRLHTANHHSLASPGLPGDPDVQMPPFLSCLRCCCFSTTPFTSSCREDCLAHGIPLSSRPCYLPKSPTCRGYHSPWSLDTRGRCQRQLPKVPLKQEPKAAICTNG